jgi:hypothetical protein
MSSPMGPTNSQTNLVDILIPTMFEIYSNIILPTVPGFPVVTLSTLSKEDVLYFIIFILSYLFYIHLLL